MLNKLTILDKVPIPAMDTLLDELRVVTVFNKLNLKSRHNHIRVLKPNFCTHNGHYEFLVMSFDLSNALATFQVLMNEIFQTFETFYIGFYYNILVYSMAMANHWLHPTKTLRLLYKNQLVLNQEKCSFVIQTVRVFRTHNFYWWCSHKP